MLMGKASWAPACKNLFWEMDPGLQDSLLENLCFLAPSEPGEGGSSPGCSSHPRSNTAFIFSPPQESHEIKATHVGGKQKATTCWAGQRYSFDAQNCLLSFWKRKKRKRDHSLKSVQRHRDTHSDLSDFGCLQSSCSFTQSTAH